MAETKGPEELEDVPKKFLEKEPECEFCGELLIQCTCEIAVSDDDI